MIICMRSEDYKNKCIVKQNKKKKTLNAVYNHIMWLSDDIKIKKRDSVNHKMSKYFEVLQSKNIS